MKTFLILSIAFHSFGAFAEFIPLEEGPICEITGSPLGNLPEDLRAIARQQNCAELPVGGVRVSHYDQNRGVLSGDYSLKRVTQNTYQARLNVTFNDGGGPGSGARMFARSRECLAQAAPYMKGPGGETLDIQILSPQEILSLPAVERPRQLNISIDSPGQGGHSYNFPSSFNCQDIIHEYLHHLGLCDEYNPSGTWNATTSGANSSCRVQPRGMAYLMNNKDAAWLGIFNRDPNDPPRREQSLLAPNHFYKILEMDCWGKSAPYQLCGSFAYRGTNCEQVPARCQDASFYLGALPERPAATPPAQRQRPRLRQGRRLRP